MRWSAPGIPAKLGSGAAFSLSDVEDSGFQRCPAHVGIRARNGSLDQAPPQKPFESLLTAMIKNLVVAVARGRATDDDGGLARAHATHEGQHPLVRDFLDAAALNYLEFLESREVEVGSLTYVDYFHRRDLVPEVSLKLWAPVYQTEDGAREVHRLRYNRPKTEGGHWDTGAAWVVNAGVRSVTVVEFGLGDGSEALLRDRADPEAVLATMETEVVPELRSLYSANDLLPGSNCVGCKAVALCPALIQMDLFPGVPDDIPWVRSISESDLARYRECPSKALAKSLHLPSESTARAGIERGVRVHRWIADRHTGTTSCADALLIEGTGVAEDEPYLDAHAALCDRTDSATLSLEQTLVGWDAKLVDVIFMKPDEVVLRNGVLVLREIKTSTNQSVLSADLAWERYANVAAWWLTVLDGGLAAHFGAKTAVLELEVLTPAGGAVHHLATDEDGARFRVSGWRLDTPALWLADRDCLPSPGPSCARCEFIRWCKEGKGHVG